MERFQDLPDKGSLVKTTVGLAMKIHRVLGTGFLEIVYANALAVELERNAIPFARESRIAVPYEGVSAGEYIADFVLQNQLVVELKAVETPTPHHSLQFLNYLAATGFDSGLLLNFGAKSLGFKTKTRVYGSTRHRPRGVGEKLPQFGNSINSV